MYYPYYPFQPLYYIPQYQFRSSYPLNIHWEYPPSYFYSNYPITTYPINQTGHSLQANDYSRNNGTVRLQNLGNSRFKDWYLDIDGNTGAVILTESSAASGINWRLTSLGGTTVTLQNLGNSRFKNWYLDIDGNTGAAILTESPIYSGTKWRLSSLGGTTVTLQNLGNSRFKDWYLDIDGNTGAAILTESPAASGINWRLNRVIEEDTSPRGRIVIGCVSGLFGHADVIGNAGMRNLRDRLRIYLGNYVKPENIFYQSWNPGAEDNPFDTPAVEILNGTIQRISRNPSYLALIGYSYGGWAVSRLSRVVSPRRPDFVGLIDPVYGPSNTIDVNRDIPRGKIIKSWYQQYAINEAEPCTGLSKIPCSTPKNGIACGNQNVPYAENIHEEFLKNWEGNRERKPCPLVGRIPIRSTHANMGANGWIWRQIADQILNDIRTI
jgi:hypothetical protein